MTPIEPHVPSVHDPDVGSLRAAVAEQLRSALVLQQCRRAASASLAVFARLVLPHHFTLPPSAMHREMFDLLGRGTEQRGMRLALAAPRGHAKSTIASLAYPLWLVATAREPFIVILSATADQAQEHLGHLRRELEHEAQLSTLFPQAAGPPSVPPWRKDELVTRGGTRIKALGAGSPVRGRRHGAHRPTLIVLDDVEDEQLVRSADRRAQLAEWFRSAVGQAGTASTNVVVIGTLLHPDALLATLVDPIRSPGWTGRVYRAVESWSERPDLWENWENLYRSPPGTDPAPAPGSQAPGTSQPETPAASATTPATPGAFFEANRDEMLRGTRVLWPEREPYIDLMAIRVRDGVHAFATEKQNEPSDAGDRVFREEDLRVWDDLFADERALIASMRGRGEVFGACDPSLGKHTHKGDSTAIVTVLRHPGTGVLYVIGADIRRRTPDETIETILALHRVHDYVRFGIESVQFQAVLATSLVKRGRARGVHVPVVELSQIADKVSRMQRLQPILASGGILLSRRHAVLMDQLRQFPRGAHDDGPDALEMAVRIAQRPRPVLRIHDPSTGIISEVKRR